MIRILIGAIALMPVYALAQDAAQNTRSPFIEEVVVTATHRETNLMDTPQAISAVSGEVIEQLGAVDMQTLFKNIPGLNMVEGQSAGNNRYIVRGVTSQTGTLSYAQTFSAVSVYLDDVPMTSAQGPASQFGGNLFDVSRVEVLKGPQGTLFGEGSVGGTIRFIQNEPELNQFDYKVKAGINQAAASDDMGHRIDGMLNIPIGDTMALRFTGFNNEKAGYFDKLDTGEEDVNTEKATGGRLSFLWLATDKLTINPTYYNVTTQTEGNVLGFAPYEEDFNVRIPGAPPQAKDDVEIFSLAVDYDLDWATLKVLSSYLDRNVHTTTESPLTTAEGFDAFIQFNVFTRQEDNPGEMLAMLGEGWNLSIFDPTGATPANQLAFNTDNTSASERKVVELRLLSNSEGDWRWTAGAFWKDSDDARRNFQPYLMRAPLTRATAPVTFSVYDEFYNDPSNAHQDTLKEISGYGEITYSILENLEVTAGARVTDMEQSIKDSLATTEDTVVSPKLGIAWWPTPDTLTYFNVTTGFRPGNLNLGMEFNARVFAGAGDSIVPETAFSDNPAMLTGNEAAALATSRVAYDGDSVVNYELGVKTQLLDGRLNLTSALYYFDWKDTILTFDDPLVPSINSLYNDNAGAAHSQGLEAEAIWLVTDQLRLRMGGDINDAELDEAVGAIPSGSALPRSPKWSVFATVDYSMQFANGWDLNTSLNHSRMARQFEALGGTTQLPIRYQTDLRFNLSNASDSWRVTLYANNITGEEAHTLNCSDAASGLECFFFQPPRVVGLELTVRPGQ